MNCCTTAETIALQDKVNEPTPSMRAKCSNCAVVSRFVTKKTMLLMLKPELFERISDEQCYFCANPVCRVAYFPETQGACFYTNNLRVRIGAKETEDPKPLCYCFGFNESDVRDEIRATGKTEIPARIAELLKAGMCACDTRNPSGACCLGEITKTVKRLQKESAQNRQFEMKNRSATAKYRQMKIGLYIILKSGYCFSAELV